MPDKYTKQNHADITPGHTAPTMDSNAEEIGDRGVTDIQNAAERSAHGIPGVFRGSEGKQTPEQQIQRQQAHNTRELPNRELDRIREANEKADVGEDEAAVGKDEAA